MKTGNSARDSLANPILALIALACRRNFARLNRHSENTTNTLYNSGAQSTPHRHITLPQFVQAYPPDVLTNAPMPTEHATRVGGS
jgi:hypothetical protein